MGSNQKNITSRNGQLVKLGDAIALMLPDQHQRPTPKKAIVVAVNAEQERGNVRYVLESALHALPFASASDVEVVVSSAQAYKPTVNANGLRLDGPTLPEFVAAGYKPEQYPPTGYAEVLTTDETEAAKLGVAEYRKLRYAAPPLPPVVPAPVTSTDPTQGAKEIIADVAPEA